VVAAQTAVTAQTGSEARIKQLKALAKSRKTSHLAS
jgi:hypothetical protein